MKIWTVDAFTDKPFAGNPAAVMIVQDFPTDEMCQNIAAEMNLSETAFTLFPVTGSAHCKLADYWQEKLGKDEFLAYQASARGGVLGVTIKGDRVHLKGQAVTILEGKLRVEW